MGLERLVSVLQDTPTNFETDLFMPIIKATEALAVDKIYGEDEQVNVSFKVIADHTRALLLSRLVMGRYLQTKVVAMFYVVY